MKRKIGIVIAFILEVALLMVVVIFLLLGIVGIFLPILPGLVLLGFAVAIYVFLLKNANNKLIHFLHHYVLKLKPYANYLKNNKIYMGIIKTIKKRREETVKQNIIKYGLFLFGFNFTLILFLFFSVLGLNIFTSFLGYSSPVSALAVFAPLVVIFFFAAVCAIIWYRFGQILRSVFRERFILNSGLVVLVSVLPLILILFFLSLISSAQILPANLSFTALIVTLLVTILAVIFEFFIVLAGTLTKV